MAPTHKDTGKVHIAVGDLVRHAKLTEFVDHHWFNYGLRAAVYTYGTTSPAPTLPPMLVEQIPSFHYYRVRTTLAELTDPAFLRPLLKDTTLQFAALSVRTRIDQHDTFAITPTGELILDLTKDTYEVSGLTGTHSPFGERNPRFTVRIDLRADAYAPGHKYYERVRWSFANALTAPCDFWLTCVNTATGKSHPFTCPDGWMAQNILSEPRWEDPIPNAPTTADRQTALIIPDVREWALSDPRTADKLLWHGIAQDFYEWLGMEVNASPQIRAGQSTNSYLSTYTVPSPHRPGRVAAVRWTGLILPAQVHAVQRALTASLAALPSRAEEDEGEPWATLAAWGFRDAPVSYGTKSHGFLVSGENDYTLAYWPDGRCVAFQANGPLDKAS
ncbi:hypothetical protein IWQ60_005904 [Tieghemiomyces parasiticus]|uniref:Uncharacterized protein n=1 Tax=Tieghemiomyces parasiticus TaxID=78921 RepID=A0A9W8DY26_9FUNG|nr:hypothetical protein IWQ60_005904 [Tieghemiomyces parasiticus]